MAQLLQQEEAGPAPESFWDDFDVILSHIARRKLVPEVHDDVDKLLRSYLRRNGSYRAESLLRGVFSASEPTAGTSWPRIFPIW